MQLSSFGIFFDIWQNSSDEESAFQKTQKARRRIDVRISSETRTHDISVGVTRTYALDSAATSTDRNTDPVNWMELQEGVRPDWNSKHRYVTRLSCFASVLLLLLLLVLVLLCSNGSSSRQKWREWCQPMTICGSCATFRKKATKPLHVVMSGLPILVTTVAKSTVKLHPSHTAACTYLHVTSVVSARM